MVGFNAYDLARVEAGEIKVTWRLWKYSHVTTGKVYGAGAGAVAVDDVRAVRIADITDADAQQAGFETVEGLIDLARGHKRVKRDELTDDSVLYRVRFHYVPEAPQKARLELPELRRRLQRLDSVSPYGPWTETALRLIEMNPQVVARELAAEMGMPTLPFKLNIRKLKALGLTISHLIGYELSDLGQEYLDSLDAEAPETE